MVHQSWKKFIKDSSAFQLATKTELLKKEIKKWKKACHNKEIQEIERVKQDIVVNQNYVMIDNADTGSWNQMAFLKS